MTSYTVYESPIGPLYITVEDGFLIGLKRCQVHLKDTVLKTQTHLEIIKQLKAYFKGSLQTFNMPIKMTGTPFQRQVYEKLKDIPFGKTISYKDLAEAIGKPGAYRAVGGALHQNPIMIILPCHRVIGKNHQLVGFAEGLKLKKTLLDLEQKNMV